MLLRVERGERFSAEPWLDVIPPPSARAAAVVAFPGRVVVAAAVDRRWVESWTADGDPSSAFSPMFLGALEEQLRLEVDHVDSVLLAEPSTGDPELMLTPVQDAGHPRVKRSLRCRDDVRAWAVDGGLLLIGTGLAGRWEVTVEVDEGHRDKGLGRALARAARHLLPERRAAWAQISPGDAAGMRAFLGAGYLPVGAEALLAPRPA